MKYLKNAAALIATAVAALAAIGVQAAGTQAPPAGTSTMGAQAMGVKFGAFFNERQKQAARRAFSQKYAKAKECPPGLEKKGKACASPWDTRYWAVGQELQPSIAVYPVPEPVVALLPTPPKGYEYVRAADDILLISSGTKLVVDMIEHVAS